MVIAIGESSWYRNTRCTVHCIPRHQLLQPCSLSFGKDGVRAARLTHCSRSPWSNEYDPPLEYGTTPSPKLRKLEIAANEAFDTYRELYALPLLRLRQYSHIDLATRDRYYEGGVSSVYLWELEDGGFAGVVLLKKGGCAVPLWHSIVLPYPSLRGSRTSDAD